jgi:CYTH domain-containing protein
MKTAVEWFNEEHLNLLIKLENEVISINEYILKQYDILQQAKEMEKEQINHFVELSRWLIENKRSVFESADISNERKKKILNELGYSSLDY